MAVQPSTGDILAVANRPADSSYDRALEGRYPPGSTFKVVTTAALLRDGLRPTRRSTARARSPSAAARSRTSRAAPRARAVREDFAQSCNTAFVSLTERLAGRRARPTGARLRPR